MLLMPHLIDIQYLFCYVAATKGDRVLRELHDGILVYVAFVLLFHYKSLLNLSS